MRVMDEKGRLFGKINVIDFLVVIFLISLTPVFYFGYKIFIKKQTVETKIESSLAPAVVAQPKKEIIEVELDFDLIKLKTDTAKLISVGDKETDEKGQAIGEIIHLAKFEPQEYKINVGAGQDRVLLQKDPILQHIVATLRIKAELKQNNIYYKDKQIMYNNPIDFKTDKYQVEALYLPPQPATKKAVVDILSTEEEAAHIWEVIRSIENRLDFIYKRLDKIEIYLKTQKLNKISSEDENKR